MNQKAIVAVITIIGALGLYCGATYNTTAIYASIAAIFILAAYLYTVLQKKEASDRTPSNPITSMDQNAIAGVSFFAVLILYIAFFYIGTLFNF